MFKQDFKSCLINLFFFVSPIKLGIVSLWQTNLHTKYYSCKFVLAPLDSKHLTGWIPGKKGIYIWNIYVPKTNRDTPLNRKRFNPSEIIKKISRDRQGRQRRMKMACKHSQSPIKLGRAWEWEWYLFSLCSLWWKVKKV